MKKLLLTTGFMAISLTALLAQSVSQIFTFPENNSRLTVSTISANTDTAWYFGGSGIGDNQFFISKVNADQEVMWSKMYSGERDINFVHQLPGDRLLVFNNNGQIFEYFDASIMRLDGQGNFLSETIWGTESDVERWGDYTVLANGEIVVLGSGSSGNTGAFFNFMLRLSANGEQVLDERMFEVDNGLIWRKIIPANNGGFYILGSSFNNLVSVAQFDEMTNLLWVRSYAWPADASVGLFNGLQLPDGNLYMYGYSEVSDVFSASEYFSCRLKPNGDFISNSVIDAPDGINPVNIFHVGGDTIAITAFTNTQIFPIVNNDNLNILANAKTGAVYQSLAFGSDTRDIPLVVKRQGNQLIWGGYTNYLTDPDTTLAYFTTSPLTGTGLCASNFALASANEVTVAPVVSNITLTELAPLPITIFNSSGSLLDYTVIGDCSGPNANEEVTDACTVEASNFLKTIERIQATGAWEIAVMITDLAGRQLVNAPLTTNPMQLFESLPNGLYIYTLGYEGCGKSKKVVGKLPVTH
jgi:hypothetical protein